MIVIGKTDSFEHKYMEKFRSFASQFGKFVNYERDRGARDIGLHLTHPLKSGKERLSSSLCWFQMKGIMKTTLSIKRLEDVHDVKLSLDVNHLKYWYLQPMPTYLVVYIECVDEFLIINIQDYVTDKWGRNILTNKQKTVTVNIPSGSALDEEAFQIILRKGDIEEWKKVLRADEEDIRLCHRDYDLIWHIATATERKVEHRVLFWDWQSKTRGQFYIQERPLDGSSDWKTLREHWQVMMNIFHLEDSYPYIEFYLRAEDEDGYDRGFFDDEINDDVPAIELRNGDIISGENCSSEYFEYHMGVKLNSLGKEMFDWVEDLVDIGLLEITEGKSEIISVAPWHRRPL